METQIVNLQAENSTLLEKVDELTMQLQQLKVDTPSDANGDNGEALSDEAIRKRLMRICSKRKDGTLGIHCFFDYVFRIQFEINGISWNQKSFPKCLTFEPVAS